MLNSLSNPPLILLLTRIVVGTTFLYYGLPKIKDLKGNAKDFEKMGFKPGWFWGTPIALLESIGSGLLILGIFGDLIALLLAGHMATGAIWKITKTEKGFTDWSYDILLLTLSLILFTFGTGMFSTFSLHQFLY